MDASENYYGQLLRGEGKYDATGKRADSWCFFDAEDHLFMEGSYLNGEKHGDWLVYYTTTDHKIHVSIPFKQGKRDGEYKALNLDGSLKISGLYSDDKPEGNWVAHDIEHNITRTEQYLNGLKHGVFSIIIDGKLVWENHYKNNMPVGEHCIYRYDQLAVRGNYVDGLKTGLWEYYYESGEIGVFGNYLKGEMDEEWIFLDRDSNREGRAFFSNGQLLKSDGEYCINEDQILDYCETRYI
jgi:antitoxin component YwqK of YwqJK toxin-antitoxin module